MKLTTALLVLGVVSPTITLAATWRPVAPAELGQGQPRVDPKADAEAILWDVRIEDRVEGESLSLRLNHYFRIKIFTPRGKDQYSTIEIPRTGSRRIKDVAARTVKSNGDVVEVKKNAIFDRELASTRDVKMHGITFAMPNVEVGDIIEYSYQEEREGESANYLRLYFQREIPIWSVTYHIKPLTDISYGMRSFAMNIPHQAFQKEKDGFYAVSVTDMPAFREEPRMPPEDQVKAWVLVYYEEDSKGDMAKYWKEVGKADWERFKPRMKADGSVTKMAQQLTSSLSTPEQKVAAIESFCRTQIRNLGSVAFHLSAEERKAVKENRSPADTLKQKAGWGSDIDFLFAAMVNAVGIEARMARTANRGDIFFDPKLPTAYFLGDTDVAVKLGDKWTFCDPATPYLDPGMLAWIEESQQALISDPKEGFFVQTQYSEPARSKRQRQGTFTLSADGTLEGTVQYTYTGHSARGQKVDYIDKIDADREKDWKEGVQDRLSNAEVSEFSMSPITDDGAPFVVKHHVKIPGFAVVTGKRILIQPGYFQKNASPTFSQADRKWDIYFSYGWQDSDDVTIELPKGWAAGQLPALGSQKLSDVVLYGSSLAVSADGRKLTYHRDFLLGPTRPLLIRSVGYATVKKYFDAIQDQDNVTLSLQAAPHE